MFIFPKFIIMSFDIYNKKPKLIEPKILRYYNEKIQNKNKIKQDEIITNANAEPWYKNTCGCIGSFIKNNYGFFLIVFLILLLLYVRYIEVNNRKKKMKIVVDQANKEKEIEQFIELQELNKKLSQYEK